ncbi:unnamed protein product, partial [marine sediment metagenome]
MNTIEGACLESLRCDRATWTGRMTRELFSGENRDIYDAIMAAEDPTDPVQVYRQLGNASLLAEAMVEGLMPLSE